MESFGRPKGCGIKNKESGVPHHNLIFLPRQNPPICSLTRYIAATFEPTTQLGNICEVGMSSKQVIFCQTLTYKPHSFKIMRPYFFTNSALWAKLV